MTRHDNLPCKDQESHRSEVANEVFREEIRSRLTRRLQKEHDWDWLHRFRGWAAKKVGYQWPGWLLSLLPALVFGLYVCLREFSHSEVGSHVIGWILTAGMVLLIASYWTYIYEPASKDRELRKQLRGEIAFRVFRAIQTLEQADGCNLRTTRTEVDNILKDADGDAIYKQFSQRPLFSLLWQLGQLNGNDVINKAIDVELNRVEYRDSGVTLQEMKEDMKILAEVCDLEIDFSEPTDASRKPSQESEIREPD